VLAGGNWARSLLSPLEPIGRIAVPVPPPPQYRHRYYGVSAPNSPLPPAASALAPEADAPASAPKPTSDASTDEPPQVIGRSSAPSLWAILLSRAYKRRR